MRFRIHSCRHTVANFRLTPDFNKSIHIDIWISRPGAYAYKIEYEPLPAWDPLERDDGSHKIEKVLIS